MTVEAMVVVGAVVHERASEQKYQAHTGCHVQTDDPGLQLGHFVCADSLSDVCMKNASLEGRRPRNASGWMLGQRLAFRCWTGAGMAGGRLGILLITVSEPPSSDCDW